jgi:tetrahydromethanopterin S-methyltransferase subunit C
MSETTTTRTERSDALMPRRALTVGGVFLLLGIALIGIGPSDSGMVVTLAALVVMIYGIHTFGRLGPA